MSLLKSTAIVGTLTLCSRILGFVRDILMAAVVGTGAIADAFFVAYRLPNFFRQLSAEGALSSAFVPIFSGKLIAEGQTPAAQFASHVLSWLCLILSILSIVMVIFMPQLMYVLAYGFRDDPTRMQLAIIFGRIVFPYILLISVISLFSGVLQSLGKFAMASFAPILLNLGMIITLLWLTEYTETPAHALSFCIIVTGILQVLLLWYIINRRHFAVTLTKLVVDDSIRQLLRRMIPGIIGGGVTQINLWVSTILATSLASGVSYLYYADRLVQFPLSLIGTALGVTLLPALSRLFKKQDMVQAIESQNSAIEVAMLLILPATIGFIVLAQPMIQVLFERGAFNVLSTAATSSALQAYAVGLPAFVLIKLFLPGFYAVGDTKTPVKVAVLCLIANVAISLLLKPWYGHVGLALSTSLTAWINVGLLFFFLTRAGRYRATKQLVQGLLRISLGCIVMFLTLQFSEQILAQSLHASPLILLLALMGIGILVYAPIMLSLGGLSMIRRL